MRLNHSKCARANGAVPLAIPLQLVGQNDVSLVGGKAASLAVLMRASLPIPVGFCVTSAAFRQFLDSCRKREDLRRLLSRMAAADAGQTARVSAQALAWLDQVAAGC